MMAFLISSVFRSKKEDGSFIKQAPLEKEEVIQIQEKRVELEVK